MTDTVAGQRTPGSVRFVVAVLGLAFALRFGAGLLMNLQPDAPFGVRGFGFYGEMADGVFAERGMGWEFYQSLGYKMANRAPLYPLLLGALRQLGGEAAAYATIAGQAAVGALGCLAPYLLGRRFGGLRAARVALVACALWPYYVVIDTSLVEHVLYTPLTGFTVWAVLRARDSAGADRGRLRDAALAGVLCGLTALTRVTFGLALPFLALTVLVRPGELRHAFAKTTVLTLATCAVLLPWALRNQSAVGAFTVGTDGGRALWLSNAPGTFDHYPRRSIDVTEYWLLEDMPADEMRPLLDLADDEVAQNAVFLERALANISDRPGATAWGALRKLGALTSWSYNPVPESETLAFTAKRTVFFAGYVLLLWWAALALRFAPRVWADLPVVIAASAGFVLPAMLFWGQSRYLAPLHGVALAVGAAGFLPWGRRRTRGDAA